MPSMNDDVPARDAEGRTSFYAEKTAQSLYAQLGLGHVALRSIISGVVCRADGCLPSGGRARSESVSVMKRLRMPQHADTDVRLRTPAVLLQEDRELSVTNHSL